MIRATDGTPLPFTKKSMYGPGGAAVRLAGMVTESPPAACEKLSGTSRPLWSKACVTEPNRMNVTLVMFAPFGVATNRAWPYATVAGVAPVMLGRAPLNRYGGDNTS